MRCLLIGNFGAGNLGDEALKEYFLTEFPDVTWVTLSAHPEGESEIARLPIGIRSFFSFCWIRTIVEYMRCDCVVFGGGSLFTDAESVYACFLWWIHAMAAAMLGKSLHFSFQGVGPFRTKTGEFFARSAIRHASTLSVRGAMSYERVAAWQLNKNIVQSFDPIFCLVKNKKIEVCTKKILILIPRNNSSEKFSAKANEAYESEKWNEVKILSMQPDDKNERRFCESLSSRLGARVIPVRNLDELFAGIAQAQLVVSERYHGALAAAVLGKRTIIVTQKPGDKLDELNGVLLSEGFDAGTAAGLVCKGERLLLQAFAKYEKN